MKVSWHGSLTHGVYRPRPKNRLRIFIWQPCQ